MDGKASLQLTLVSFKKIGLPCADKQAVKLSAAFVKMIFFSLRSKKRAAERPSRVVVTLPIHPEGPKCNGSSVVKLATPSHRRSRGHTPDRRTQALGGPPARAAAGRAGAAAGGGRGAAAGCAGLSAAVAASSDGAPSWPGGSGRHPARELSLQWHNAAARCGLPLHALLTGAGRALALSTLSDRTGQPWAPLVLQEVRYNKPQQTVRWAHSHGRDTVGAVQRGGGPRHGPIQLDSGRGHGRAVDG